MICRGCGGVVGRDCFNPAECEWIAQDMQRAHWEALEREHYEALEREHYEALEREHYEALERASLPVDRRNPAARSVPTSVPTKDTPA